MEIDKLICEKRTYTEKSYTHEHSFSQLILPLQGSLNISTNRFDLELNEDHMFFMPPRCSHSFSSRKMNKFLVLDIGKSLNSSRIEEGLNSEIHHELDDKWKAIRFLLLNEVNEADSSGLNHLANYVCDILLTNDKPKSIQYIQDNYNQAISIRLLASIENYSENYYIEWFNKIIGMTPTVYIQKLRMEKTIEFLSKTNLSILRISQLVGYEQQSSLTRVFKKHKGVSPSEYRKNIREMGKTIIV